MSRLRALLRKKRGFTLIEMIVAMTVSALLMAGIAALLPSFVKIHAHSIDLSYAKKISNSIEEALGNELSFASRVSVSADGAVLTYTGRHGEKTVDGDTDPPVVEGLAYDPGYYMGQQVTLRFSLDGEVCTVSIAVRDRTGGSLYSADRPIRLHGVQPAASEP
ncbi:MULTISPECIES: PulJ/GspJ family protein [Anaerotruncus]|uniref:PulJ/GspJ family protein n=1 Tax=Anaerotruncus TaxID=244127 RepID=UPI00258A27E1|nr:prepilin-type N-terminal cleavage/methylation domain-containing protein [Anaerotruncus massiliensis (ex Togo et al. 2019)]